MKNVTSAKRALMIFFSCSCETNVCRIKSELECELEWQQEIKKVQIIRDLGYRTEVLYNPSIKQIMIAIKKFFVPHFCVYFLSICFSRDCAKGNMLCSAECDTSTLVGLSEKWWYRNLIRRVPKDCYLYFIVNGEFPGTDLGLDQKLVNYDGMEIIVNYPKPIKTYGHTLFISGGPRLLLSFFTLIYLLPPCPKIEDFYAGVMLSDEVVMRFSDWPTGRIII